MNVIRKNKTQNVSWIDRIIWKQREGIICYGSVNLTSRLHIEILYIICLSHAYTINLSYINWISWYCKSSNLELSSLHHRSWVRNSSYCQVKRLCSIYLILICIGDALARCLTRKSVGAGTYPSYIIDNNLWRQRDYNLTARLYQPVWKET